MLYTKGDFLPVASTKLDSDTEAVTEVGQGIATVIERV